MRKLVFCIIFSLYPTVAFAQATTFTNCIQPNVPSGSVSTRGGRFCAGTGNPNGAFTGWVGDVFSQRDGTTTILWVKNSGAGTTSGWVSVGSSGSTLTLGNNSPSLSSPKNAAFAVSQNYPTPTSSADDAVTITNTWTPVAAAATGQSDALLVDAILNGTQNYTADMYGEMLTVETHTSGTTSKIEGLRVQATAANAGVVGTAYGIGSVLHVDHGTLTEADNFHAYVPQVGTSGVLSKGVEFFGEDPTSSSCTTCVSIQLNGPNSSFFLIAPSPNTAGTLGFPRATFIYNPQLTNTDYATPGDIAQFSSVLNINSLLTLSGYLNGLDQNVTLSLNANLLDTGVSGMNAEVCVCGSGANDHNTTSHTGSGVTFNPVTGISGLNAEWDWYSTGTAQNADAILVQVGDGGGVITKATGIRIVTPYDETGTPTEYDGLNIEDVTWAGTSINYAIKYSAPHGTSGIMATGAVELANVTVAQLPTTHNIGDMFAVTDGTGSLAWGATVTGGASTKYIVWWNGANWTVVGK